MSNKVLILPAPSLYNSSCAHPRYSVTGSSLGADQQDGSGGGSADDQSVLFIFINVIYNTFVTITIGDVIQLIIIVVLTFGILFANLLLIIVINSQRYIKYIHSQPRYLLTSLASIDFAIGLLITPLSIIPTIKHCWPFGELICQIQALLRVALAQQSAVILICMAIDRYVCMLYPVYYHKHSTKKGCFAIISITGIINVILFAFIIVFIGDNQYITHANGHMNHNNHNNKILNSSAYNGGGSGGAAGAAGAGAGGVGAAASTSSLVGYYFNKTGSLSCEPYYYKSSYRILIACCFYFPTTMILMYCYGSAFHVNKLRLKKYTINSITTSGSNRYLNSATNVNFVNIGGGGGGVGDRNDHGSCHINGSMDDQHNITITTQQDHEGNMVGNGRISIEKIITSHERRLSTSASRTMAAMSLGFIVLVTPYSIQEVVAACTGQRAPEILDFIATWLQLSNAFWNPFLYWLLNNHFRRISKDIIYTHFLCRRKKTTPDITTIKSSYNTTENSYSDNDNDSYTNDRQLCQITVGSSEPDPSGGAVSLNITSTENAIHNNLSAEQYWGEILERTLSSNSLQQLQKSINYYPRNEDEDDRSDNDPEDEDDYNNLSSSYSNSNNHDTYYQHHLQHHSVKCINYQDTSQQYLSVPDL